MRGRTEAAGAAPAAGVADPPLAHVVVARRLALLAPETLAHVTQSLGRRKQNFDP